MLKVGLTGGIASGKTAAADFFHLQGARLIDADVIARKVVEPGSEGLERIVCNFGRGVLNDNGSLDREKLGNIIFHDRQQRELLNRLLHPLILHDIEQQLAQIAASEPDAITVVDLPLLVECGLKKKFDCIVMVYTSRKIQIQRLMKRDRISEREALHRLSTQMDIEEKKHHAHYIIENNGTIDMLARQVRHVYARLYRNRM